jgi:GTPase SAR1 family protein
MRKQPIRILVFGGSGTGKTTVCNQLSGGNMQTGNSPLGVTCETQVYPPFQLDDETCILTDTVGLNESHKGRVPAKIALSNLIKLLKDSKNGYNLLMQVVKVGRLDNNTVENYNLFIRALTGGKIPVILVVTGGDSLSDEQPMNAWAVEHKSEIESLGLCYKTVQVVAFHDKSKHPALEEFHAGLRKQSITSLVGVIHECSAPTSIRLYKSNTNFLVLLRKGWNVMCKFFEIDKWKVTVRKEIVEILMKLGFNKEDAKEIEGNF